jgi:hypothetical protein
MSSMRDTSVGRMNWRHITENTAIYYNNTTCLQWETPLLEEWIEDTLQKTLLSITITQHVFNERHLCWKNKLKTQYRQHCYLLQ